MEREKKKKHFIRLSSFIIVIAFLISFFWIKIAVFSAKAAAKLTTNDQNYTHIGDSFKSTFEHSKQYYVDLERNTSELTDLFISRPASLFLRLYFFILCFLIPGSFPNKKGEPLYISFYKILVFTYIYSFIYATAGFIITPLGNLVAVCVFMPIITLFQTNKIDSVKLFALIATVILLGNIASMASTFMILLPTVHILTLTTVNALKSRYTNEETKISVKLSSTQKKQIQKSAFYRITWWEAIEPVIDELTTAWNKNRIFLEQLGFVRDKRNVHHFEWEQESEESIKDSLIKLQSKEDKEKALQALREEDPKFSEKEFINRFLALYEKILKACSKQKIDEIQPMVSDALFEQFKYRISEQKSSGIRFDLKSFSIKNIKIARITTSKDFDQLHLHVVSEIKENAVDIVTGESLNTNTNDVSKITEIWTFIRRPSAKTLERPGLLESNCPNCGAPIEIGQATICHVCHSYLRSGTYDWVLAQITQSCEWRYTNPQLIPNWKELEKQDSNICIQQIEDKASVIFWILRNTEQTRKSEALLRFSSEDFYKNLKQCQFNKNEVYTCYENISLGSVSLNAIKIDKQFTNIYLLVLWNAIENKFDKIGRINTLHRIMKPYRNVFVLKRKNNITTKSDNTLSSAHCPNCGAQLTSSFSVKCDYCDTILNDGSDWVLQRITNENDKEYVKFIKKRFELMDKIVQEKEEINAIEETKAEVNSAVDIISVIAKIMLADGVVTQSELDEYKKMCKKYEIDAEKALSIFNAVKANEIEISLEHKKGKKIAYDTLDAIIEMAMADGVIQDEEKSIIMEYGKKLGFSPLDIKMKTRNYLTEEQKQEIRNSL